jgi:N-acylglucosamine 2-epimerase
VVAACRGPYATLLGHRLGGDERLAEWHRGIHDYTFATFPAGLGEGREWVQIRDRAGRPLDKVVVLPVKDPFLITRCLLLMIELLTDQRRWHGGRRGERPRDQCQRPEARS